MIATKPTQKTAHSTRTTALGLVKAVVVMLATLCVSGCESPTRLLHQLMNSAGLTSDASEELAEEFELACDHYLECAAESASTSEERTRFREMAQMCEASSVMVSVISVLGEQCGESAHAYIRCVTSASCAELAETESPQTVCESELDAMKIACERQGDSQ